MMGKMGEVDGDTQDETLVLYDDRQTRSRPVRRGLERADTLSAQHARVRDRPPFRFRGQAWPPYLM